MVFALCILGTSVSRAERGTETNGCDYSVTLPMAALLDGSPCRQDDKREDGRSAHRAHPAVLRALGVL